MQQPVDDKHGDIYLDALEKPVPREFGKAFHLEPTSGVCSMPLGSVAGSRSPNSNDFEAELIWPGNVFQAISRGISASVEPPEVLQLPSVRKGLSNTQFHPGAVARGVSPNLLLHSGGVLLQNGEGRRNDYHLSQELNQRNLDMFISHSWTVGRWRKFLVMALYFNGQQAAIVSLLVQLLCLIGVCAGILPVVGADATYFGISPWCLLCGSLAFWLCVFLWHELVLLCRRRSSMAFFDTVCIDQSDEEKKREGIEAITAYLCHSDKLFVVLSEVYLMRIWTVFEMAAFLAVKHAQDLDSQSVGELRRASEKSQVIVQPVALAALIPACFLFQMARPFGDFARYTVQNSTRPDGTRDIPRLVSAAVLIVAGVFMIMYLVTILKSWGRTRSQLAKQVDSFSFSSAMCHHEPDRREISLAVKYLGERTGLVDAEATLQEAQEALERHARQMVWPAMQGALSPAGIPVWDAWLIALPVIAVAFDDMAMSITMLWDQRSFSLLFTNAISHSVVAVTFPVVIALVSISFCRPQRGCCYEFLATCGCVLATFVFTSIRGILNGQLPLLSEGDGLARLNLLLCVVLLIEALILWCCYGSGLEHLRRFCCCCR